MTTSLRSKWAAGKARGGRISEAIRNRRATQPPAHFHRNPLGRVQLAVFPRCSLLTYQFRYARRYCQSGSDRLEKQPTNLRRKACYFGDRTLTVVFVQAISAIDLDRRMSNPKALLQALVDRWDDRFLIGIGCTTHMQCDQGLFSCKRPGMNMVHLRDRRQH